MSDSSMAMTATGDTLNVSEVDKEVRNVSILKTELAKMHWIPETSL